MSGTYFCFSDECGLYKPKMNTQHINSHPFKKNTLLK